MKTPFEKHSRFSYLSQIHKDDGAVSTFNHQICCLLKYFGFIHVWENKTRLSIPKLLHALKKVLCSISEQFFFASITRLPISLMRNRRLSKEIPLLIFRFRRRGATKGKQSVPAWIK